MVTDRPLLAPSISYIFCHTLSYLWYSVSLRQCVTHTFITPSIPIITPFRPFLAAFPILIPIWFASVTTWIQYRFLHSLHCVNLVVFTSFGHLMVQQIQIRILTHHVTRVDCDDASSSCFITHTSKSVRELNQVCTVSKSVRELNDPDIAPNHVAGRCVTHYCRCYLCAGVSINLGGR